METFCYSQVILENVFCNKKRKNIDDLINFSLQTIAFVLMTGNLFILAGKFGNYNKFQTTWAIKSTLPSFPIKIGFCFKLVSPEPRLLEISLSM